MCSDRGVGEVARDGEDHLCLSPSALFIIQSVGFNMRGLAFVLVRAAWRGG